MNKVLKKENVFSSKESGVVILFFLSAFFAPFCLLLIEQFIGGASIFLEEIFKASVILILSFFLFNRIFFLISSFFFGLFFSFSENIFYLNNFFLSGFPEQFWERYMATSFLHAGTAFIAGLAIYKKRYFFPVVLVFNIILHYIFNSVF